MVKLLVGLLLWTAAHFIKRLVPGLRRDMAAAMGAMPSKAVIGVVLIGATYLIVSGYRGAEVVSIYTPIPGMGYVNNLLMLVALFVFGAGRVGGRISAKIRHPMLWGLVIWSVAHLLVNGDLAGVVMFAGLGLWALAQIYLINQNEGPWEVPLPGNAVQDWKLALASVFLFFAIAGVHWLFDNNPFLGTYT